MLLLQRTQRTATRGGGGRGGRLVGQRVELRGGRSRVRRWDHPWRRSAGRCGAGGWPLAYWVVAHCPLELGGVLPHKGVATGWGHLGRIWGAVIASKCVEVWRWGVEQGLLALRRTNNRVGVWRGGCWWRGARGGRVYHSHAHWVWRCTGVVLEGHPLIALRRKARLAIKGQAMTVTVAVLHRLVGRSGRSRKRSRSRVRMESHVAICRGVLQTAALEVRQVLERRGAQGGAGGLQG